jgi:iron complex transport system substrate-binding protein
MSTLHVKVKFLAAMAVAALAASAVAITGCGGSAGHVAAAARSHADVSVTVHAANGLVTVGHRPVRIISLSASATEDLFAIGAGRQVIAADSYSYYPRNAPRTKLSAYYPNIEAIANYRPDLVVVSDNTKHIIGQLGQLHIPVLLEPAPPNLAAAYAEITQLGQATGHQAGAARVITMMRSQIAAIVRSVPRPARPLTVYHELDQNYYSADSHTFIGQIYKMFGLINIADKASRTTDWPQLSAEYIITANPNLIVLADTVCCKQSRATVGARPGWGDIAAVRSGMILPVNDAVASEWGPRIVLFVQTVASVVRKLEARR